ncbi:phage minor tail protein L [uncultured Mediterranean phage uvMED]|nr:phage minor tail protein L [uncultured Mediterranean phage uvMED]
MATFPSIIPSYGTTKSAKPKTRTVKFADGYEHRINFGLAAHSNPREYSFTWNNITEGEADSIFDFLDERKIDNESFTYTPQGEASSQQFVCDNYNKTIPYNDRATVTATFRQVFEPS